uniref:SET domain-containing protein n=1 Tax=Clytia hemisphaerica TaxID=252671 RepID=A0A7M5XL46_9CNID
MRSTRSKEPSPKVIRPDEFCGSGLDQPGFELLKISSEIGYGVVTKRFFKSGDFLLEYAGERISKKEATDREKSYAKKGIGCYMFTDILGIKKRFCIDATGDTQLCW